MTTTVHHLENSRSQRVLWLLEELGVAYDVKRYARDRKTMLAPAELRAIHPLGRSPVVVDDNDVLAESGAIIETLVERHDSDGALAPVRDTPARLQWRYWLHFAEGTAMPPLVMSLVFGKIRSAAMPFFAKPIARAIADKAMGGFVGPQVEANAAYIESHLAAHAWFAGDDFSAADVQMSFPVEATSARFGLERFPAMAAWLAKVQSRPAYQRALERGGPYRLMR